MSFHNAARVALATVRERPTLLLVGWGVVAAQIGVGVASGLVQGLLLRWAAAEQLAGQPYTGALLGFVGPLLATAGLVLTLPLLVALYVPADAPPRGVRATIRLAFVAVRTRYRAVLGAVVRAEGAAILAGVVALVGWYVVSTAGRAIRYLLWNPKSPYPMETVYLSAVALGISFAVARLVTGFADVAVLRDGIDTADAWRVSVGFARSNPLTVAAYGVTAAFASIITLVPMAALGGPLGLAASTLVGGVAITHVAALHLTVFDRHARVHELAVRARRSTWPRSDAVRVALVAAVLLAGVGGAAAIRLDETAVHAPSMDRPPADATPDEVYRVALVNTISSNHRTVLRSYNLTGGERRPQTVWDTRYDFADRQALIHFYAPAGSPSGTGGGGYYDTGVLGVQADDEAGPAWDGEWQPLPAPGWAFIVDRHEGRSYGWNLPNSGVDWRVLSSNESTLVLRVTGDAVGTALEPESYAGMGGNLSEDSRLTVWVDRERAVVDRATWVLESNATGERYSYEVRTSEVGSYDVSRPASMPPRHPMEWLWDAVYY